MYSKHIVRQGPVIGALLRTGWLAFQQKPSKEIPPPPETPGPELTEIVSPRPASLVSDYLRHIGANSSSYKGVVPFHLYPQWTFPLLSRTLTGIPYDMTKVLNGGVSATIHKQLPMGEPLHLSARLDRVDANERRAILTQRLTVGTASVAEALVIEQTAIVPLKRDPSGKKKEKPRVPKDYHEVGRFRASANAGLEFAYLTGDFNPLHWVSMYAKMAGHPSPILHGFSTMARAIEILNKNVWAGDIGQLENISVRFTRPLRLPANVGVFIDYNGGLAVGDAPDGPAYLVGTYNTTQENK